MEGRGRGAVGWLISGKAYNRMYLLFTSRWAFKLISGIVRYSGKCCHQVEFSFSSSFSQCDNAMPASSRWQDSHFKPLARVLATKPWKLVPLSVNPLEKKKKAFHKLRIQCD